MSTPTKATTKQTPAAPKRRRTRPRLPKRKQPIIAGIALPRAKPALKRANVQDPADFEVESFHWSLDSEWPNVAIHRGHRSWRRQMSAGQAIITSIKLELEASRGICASRVCNRIQEDRRRIGMVEKPTKCFCSWCQLDNELFPPSERRPSYC